MANINMISVGNASHCLSFPLVTCSTAKATAAKTVTATGADLTVGTTLIIKFTNGNSAASPTLNLNSLGAKNIVGTGLVSPTNYGSAGSLMQVIYDGTSWQIIG